MHIGIDVGGTNTDAVLMDGRSLVASVKATTTPDVTGGIVDALSRLLTSSGVEPHGLAAVAIGTTHFTNAVIQASGLAQTAAIRLGQPANAGVTPMTGWPANLRSALGGRAYLCHGGHEFDGRRISALDPAELRRVAAELGESGVTCAAVTSVFSPVSSEVEEEAAAILAAENPALRLSLSHEIGRIGLIERENATIINASLLPVAETIAQGFIDALAASGIDAPLYFSSNDGTLMDADLVRRHPVATFAAGPTNSMRGAAVLSGLADCIVVDVGGTTTDIGAVVRGFPRPATAEVEIAGVRTNFRMPDIVSLAIGGGSTVTPSPTPSVGPGSVGYRLRREALVFGGSTLTVTDAAVAAGITRIGDPSLVRHLDRALARKIVDGLAARIGRLAGTMRTVRDAMPLVLVGGGGVLLPERIPGFDRVIRPRDYAVANAIGAAITQVAGEVDRVYSGQSDSRLDVLASAREEAIDRAILAGADPGTVTIVELDELPIAYLPGNAVRIRAKAVGDLLLESRPPHAA